MHFHTYLNKLNIFDHIITQPYILKQESNNSKEKWHKLLWWENINNKSLEKKKPKNSQVSMT